MNAIASATQFEISVDIRYDAGAVPTTLQESVRHMQLRLTYFVLTACFLVAPRSATSQSAPMTAKIEINVLTDLIGYIEPCGCTVDVMLGGLARLVGWCSESRVESPPPLRLVIGHTFFDPNAASSLKVQDKLKAALIGDALRQSGFTYAIRPNNSHYVTGDIIALERAAGLRSVSQPTMIEHRGISIGLVPISSKEDLKNFRSAKPNIARDANLVIAVSFLSRLETRRLLRDINWIDVTILAHQSREQKTLELVSEGYLLEAGDRGRHIAQLVIEGPAPFDGLHYTLPLEDLTPNPLFNRPISQTIAKKRAGSASLKFELIALDQSIQPEANIAHRITSYTESLRGIYATKTRQDSPVDNAQSPYAGIQVCADCHPDAVEFWNKTAHAKAWSTLEARNKTFDAECIGCHVTGWNTLGGSSIGYTAKLENVQCEVCHGPGKGHAEAGGDTTLLTTQYHASHCATCHNEHHSPRFSYPSYRERILGPGHGSPLDSPP